MKLVSGIVDSGFFAQSALSAEVATKDSLGRNISETYLTGVDLTPYQEKADMTAYATVESLTAKQDAGDYLSATDSANFLLTSDSGNFYPMNENPSGYLTAHQSLADYQTTADMVNYQTTADMTGYQSAGDYYSASNPSGFLVADDITGKLDASIYAADSGSFLTGVPDTYLQNTDLEISDNKITGISGIPLSAGGDVPEGVMVESGLEYNAVDEISGYNGSAIAQYGAEKQWLQHDDTIVHVSNSAQYAFGVNLSAVAQLLGVDETVLYSGNLTGNNSTAELSETVNNFERIKIYGHTDDGTAYPWYIEAYTTGSLAQIGIATTNNGWAKWFVIQVQDNNLKNISGKAHTWGATGWSNLANWGTTKIIGVHRISG